VGVLQVIRALDPSGVNTWYPPALVSLISNEVGCFLFTGFAYLNYLTLTFNYRLWEDPPPKLLKISFIGFVSLQWLIGNIISIVLWVANSSLMGYAVLLFWVGFIAMPLSLVILDISIYFLKKLLYQSAADQMALAREAGSYGSVNPEHPVPSSETPTTTPIKQRKTSSHKDTFSSPSTARESVTKEDPILDSKSLISSSPHPSSSLSSESPVKENSPSHALRRPSISTTSVSVSVSVSVAPPHPISPPSSPPHRSSTSSNSPPSGAKPELTVTKSKALRKLVTLQVSSHVVGLVVMGFSIAYFITIVRGLQVERPNRENYTFWWTIFAHLENGFAMIMLWYVWRPISHLMCRKKGKSLINSIRPNFRRPPCLNPSGNSNFKTPFVSKERNPIKPSNDPVPGDK